MPKSDRLQIHTIAHRFFITSKSQGKGNNRFPVLYKTKRTTIFDGDEDAIDQILYNNMGPRSRRGPGSRSHRLRDSKQPVQSGREPRNVEGTVVGTGAAELGEGNKGFDMLAKMGWTTGTGLGSSRSGIIDPVQAIVKNSRTGLG